MRLLNSSRLAAVLVLTARLTLAVEPPGFEDLLQQASNTYDAGNAAEALKLATQAIAIEPENPRGYFERAAIYEQMGRGTNAVADYDQVLQREPSRAQAWQNRGTEHFKLGHITEALADFDKFLKLVPQQAPQHWQRGIALYYADRFTDGRKQFELHRTVNPNDVENAVWHFLCVTRESGLTNARAALIPITGDARVPMMQVHALFAGQATPEDVLKAARKSPGTTTRLKQQLFYAHLYLGLYYEAIGDGAQARQHIKQAAGEYRTDDYMGDVARVHQRLRWPEVKPAAALEKKN